MDKAGERLKKIRLEKGIAIEEVAQRTKVPLNILKAIEDDGFINLEPVYVKGFIKIYCNYLGVTPSDFISELKEPQVTMKLSDDEEKASTFLRPLPVRRSFPWQRVFVFAGVVAGLVLILLAGRGISRALRNRVPAEAKTRPAASKTVSREKTAAAAPVEKRKQARQAAPAPVTAAVSARPEQAGIRLGIHAVDDCWMQVKVDGKTVFQSVLLRGRMESWTARDRIDLWLGSAGGVEVEVNGSRIPSLGRKGQVLKNIVISKDGLKVGK